MTVQPTDSPLTDRQRTILQRVAEDGFVMIEALATDFAVSAQTVRRDIIALSEGGHVQRFHGGAGPVSGAELARPGYGMKRDMARAEKLRLARHVAQAVPDRASLYLDVGTTAEACARALAKRPGFRVWTNSMRVALAFDPSKHDVYMLGGRLAGLDGSVIGEDAVARLREVHLDVALIACSGIDATGRVMDFDTSKIAVKKAAMGAAERSFLVATTRKFGRSAVDTVSRLDAFDTVFTENGPLR